ncbi:MAG TPA: ABC transporter ATP-binding protein, partial [Polyangiaceae bacterium]|nr:ABC transporter ATP-binding protein [Polyangiaceae bacterium]
CMTSRTAFTSKSRFKEFVKRQKPGAAAADPTRQDTGSQRKYESEGARRKSYARRYLGWLHAEHRALATIFVLALIGIGADMTWPLVSRYLIDHVVMNNGLLASEKVRRLTVYCSLMVLLFGTNSLFNLMRSFRMQLLNARLSFGLRSRLFHRILRLPLSDITEMKTGGVISRLSNDVDNSTSLLNQALISPTLSSIRLLVTLCIIYTLNWKIATAVILALPPIIFVQNLWVRRIRPIWKSMGQDRQDIDGRVSEALNGLRVVRGFGRERREELAYAVGHHTVIRKQMLATGTQRIVALIWDLILPLTQVTIIGYGGYLVIHGQTTVGTLVAFQGYLWRLLDPVMQIVNSISETQRGLAALERVFDLLDKPEEKPDRPHAVEAPSLVRTITFEQVSFEYRPGTPVIEEFQLTVPGGSVVALVGPSGAGKTTITDLVARFHDPTQGRILLNGKDICDIKLRSYRGLLGIVQQEVFLFDGSVRDNIAYGRPSASDEEVRDAARRANAEEFIVRLPDGYDTVVGERGVKLSGGQRQRLSIARALLANPAILILDEATSNLDSESEQLIQASMKELLRDRTTFVIAHRLSTVRDANHIVVLDRGQIREVGT